MIKNLYTFFLLVLMFGMATNTPGQEKTAKPVMKITVEDGKVVQAVPLDNNGTPDRAAMHYLKNKGAIDPQEDPSRTIIIQDTVREKLIQTSGVEIPLQREKVEKGNLFPAKKGGSVLILDPMQANVNYMGVNDVKEGGTAPESPMAPEDGWELLLYEDFEGSFPYAPWNCYASSGYADAYWDENAYRSSSGGWSMFCADIGTDAVTPPSEYPINMRSWAIYGPFDLSDVTAAQMDFFLWLEAETDYDYFHYGVSLDGSTFYTWDQTGTTGDAWEPRTLDLTSIYSLGDVTGSPQVWVAFVFTSDGNIGYQGAFVDEIELWAWNTSLAGPDLIPESIGYVAPPWIVGDSYTVDLRVSNIGDAHGSPFASRAYLSDNTTISDADYQLGGDLNFGAIAPGASQQVARHPFNCPNVPNGDYYLGFIIDYYDACAESNESNNTARTASPFGVSEGAPPDLYSTDISLSSGIWSWDQSISADLIVVNGGNTAGEHYSRLYLSVDNSITTSDHQLGGDLYCYSIGSGGFYIYNNHTFTVPHWDNGSYYVGIIIDIFDNVQESDESNNAAVLGELVDIIAPTFTISTTVQPPGSGTVSGAGVYDLNQSATLVATPAAGYEFVNWTEGSSVVATSPSYTFTVTTDRSLVANFQLLTLQVDTEVDPAGAGTATGGGSFSYGSTVTLSAAPATGFEFVNWTVLGAEVSIDPTYVFTVTENTVATAHFTVATVNVTLVAEPSEWGTVAGGGDFLYGDPVVLAAVPADAYRFRHWTDGSDQVLSAENPYSFTAEQDITVKGIFVDPTGIGDHEYQNFELYPNPMGDHLLVKVNTELSESAVFSLHDVSGKVLTIFEGSNRFKDVLELNTSHLEPGVYFIKITDEETDKRFTGKVIKK